MPHRRGTRRRPIPPEFGANDKIETWSDVLWNPITAHEQRYERLRREYEEQRAAERAEAYAKSMPLICPFCGAQSWCGMADGKCSFELKEVLGRRVLLCKQCHKVLGMSEVPPKCPPCECGPAAKKRSK